MIPIINFSKRNILISWKNKIVLETKAIHMKLIYSVLVSLIFLTLIVSCEKSVEEEQIPMNYLSFSCKLNGEPITIKSPLKISYETFGGYYIRLYKLKNNPKDSAVIGYSKSFGNDSLYIEIGYSRSILVDTTFHFMSPGTEVVKQVFAPGTFRNLYDDPQWGRATVFPQVEGFYIQIKNNRNKTNYTSYLKDISDYSDQKKYREFLSGNSCRINKLMIVDGKKQSYSGDGYYIESEFDCKLYKNSNITSNSIRLSDGHFNGIFNN